MVAATWSLRWSATVNTAPRGGVAAGGALPASWAAALSMGERFQSASVSSGRVRLGAPHRRQSMTREGYSKLSTERAIPLVFSNMSWRVRIRPLVSSTFRPK